MGYNLVPEPPANTMPFIVRILLEQSTIAVHLFVIFLIIAADYFVHPILMIEIPTHSFLYPHGKGGLGIPA